MYFSLTDDQLAVQETVRRLAREELAAGYLARAKSSSFPWELHRKVAGLGALGVLTRSPLNPMGGPDYVCAGVIVEELAYGDTNLANAAIIPMFTAALIAEHGTPAVQDRLLGPLVAGETLVSFCLTEPGSGSDAGAMRTTATWEGDGYRLDGEKTSVSLLAHAEAAIVLARTRRDGADAGVSAFVVPLDAAGVDRAPFSDTGWQALGRGGLGLSGARVGPDALLGSEGAAFRTILNGFDYTRPLLVLTTLGCARAAIDETAAYVAERAAFGSTLSRFEGVSFPLAEHATRLEAARLLCYDALGRRAADQPHTATAAMCKWFGPQVAREAVHDCLLLHGHSGYTKELPFEQRLRDVMAIEIADGTAQVQKMIIARELFGEAFLPYARG